MNRPSHHSHLQTNSVGIATYTAGLLQAQSYRALKGFISSQLADHDLTMPQWALLGILNDSGRQRLSVIAERMQVEASLTTTLTNNLLEKKLLERTPDPSDSRARLVQLTPRGKRSVEAIERHLREEMKSYLHDIAPAELVIYIGVMSKLAAKEL